MPNKNIHQTTFITEPPAQPGTRAAINDYARAHHELYYSAFIMFAFAMLLLCVSMRKQARKHAEQEAGLLYEKQWHQQRIEKAQRVAP